MKILAVSHEFPPIGGGGANACWFLTKGFADRGHEVTLVTANYNNMPQRELVNGVDIYRVNSKRRYKEHCSFGEMLSYLKKALPLADKLQKQHPYDVCLVFFGIPSGPVGYVLKKKYRLPYVIRFGGGDVPGFQERFTNIYKVLAPAIKAIWNNADARVANSGGLRRLALDFYGKKEFQVICNGVDTKLFCPAPRKEKEYIQILFVSRLIERKGLQYVLPHLGKIQQETGRRILLVVVGDGPYRGELENIAKEHHVEELLRFEGQKDREELVPYYQQSDLFILPSAKEGMPNVVLEAMACGLPIVMTPCEGSGELVDGNGIVSSLEHFPENLVKLISDDQICDLYRKASRQAVADRFSWDKVVDRYLGLLEESAKNEL